LKFEKREILLIVGIIFLMVGMMAILAPIYALIIAILIYFAMKVFVGRRKKQIQKEMGEGICAICGAKITENKCPKCDSEKQEKT
jgi:phosphate/sulfate permease